MVKNKFTVINIQSCKLFKNEYITYKIKLQFKEIIENTLFYFLHRLNFVNLAIFSSPWDLNREMLRAVWSNVSYGSSIH